MRQADICYVCIGNTSDYGSLKKATVIRRAASDEKMAVFLAQFRCVGHGLD